MTVPELERFAPLEYLARERVAESKSEYRDGQIVAMSGVTRAHSLITGSIARLLGNQLLDRPCEVHSGDLRVRIPSANIYTYPDVIVVCGEPRLEDEHFDTLLNPTVIVEVLSPSTEAYDRGQKFSYYRTVESLREYLLVAQNEPRIDRFVKQETGPWALHDAVSLDAVVELTAIGCTLPLRQVYHRVSLT